MRKKERNRPKPILVLNNPTIEKDEETQFRPSDAVCLYSALVTKNTKEAFTILNRNKLSPNIIQVQLKALAHHYYKKNNDEECMRYEILLLIMKTFQDDPEDSLMALAIKRIEKPGDDYTKIVIKALELGAYLSKEQDKLLFEKTSFLNLSQEEYCRLFQEKNFAFPLPSKFSYFYPWHLGEEFIENPIGDEVSLYTLKLK